MFRNEVLKFIEKIGILEATKLFEEWFFTSPAEIGAWLSGEVVPPHQNAIIIKMRNHK